MDQIRDEQECLDYDPFNDADDDRVSLSDRIVTIKKPRFCTCCKKWIPVGTRARARTDAVDDGIEKYTWCPDCCNVMIAASIPDYQ